MKKDSNIELVSSARMEAEQNMVYMGGYLATEWSINADDMVVIHFEPQYQYDCMSRWVEVTLDADTGVARQITEYVTEREEDGNIRSRTNTMLFDENGQLIQHAVVTNYIRNGLTYRVEQMVKYYINGVLSTKVTNSTDLYYEGGQLTHYTETSLKEEFDAEGNVTQESFRQRTITAGGVETWTSEYCVGYDSNGNIESGYIFQKECDQDGKILSMGGILFTEDETFMVTYDLDENGRVVRTNVVDNEGNTVSYDGFVHPADISISKMQEEMEDIIKQNELNTPQELQHNEDMDRLAALLSQAQSRDTNGVKFVPDMTYDPETASKAAKE